MKIPPFRSFFLLLLAALCLLLLGYFFLFGVKKFAGPFLIAFLTSLAIYFMGHPKLRSFAFTIWVFAFVSISMIYPSTFMSWFGLDLGILIVPLIQVIMFGMGTTLSLQDFTRVFKMPFPVFVGLALQFIIMPLLGLSLAKLFQFDPEISAGIVLIGSCPGGVASNLMTYLAGGNVALSVTMTSCSTLASPVLTPLLMDKLAGQFIEISFLDMMFGIINMIIVPILAGLAANRILYSKNPFYRSAGVLSLTGMLFILLALLSIFLVPSNLITYKSAVLQKDGFIVGFLLIGLVALAKLVISIWLKGPDNWMDKTLPTVSMAGICLIIAIITARSADKLVSVGLMLIAVAVIHNALGYLFGYWLARLVRLDKISCRTVAFEVGMQNGGMASGLAMNVLKSSSAALAPAIFGPWMNVSGSMLATWWHKKKLVRQPGGKAE